MSLFSRSILCLRHVHAGFLGMPFSKPLYTVSYMLLTGGVSGFLLLLLYYIVSFLCFRSYIILCPAPSAKLLSCDHEVMGLSPASYRNVRKDYVHNNQSGRIILRTLCKWELRASGCPLEGRPGAMVKLLSCDHEVMGLSLGNIPCKNAEKNCVHKIQGGWTLSHTLHKRELCTSGYFLLVVPNHFWILY
jgi:hypothetical protein